MVFSKNNLEFRIIDVFSINQGNSHKYGKNRNFCTISFRLEAKDEIVFNGERIQMNDGTVAFFPNNVDFERITESVNMIAVDLEMLNYTSNRIENYTTKHYAELSELFKNLYKSWISPHKSRRYKATAALYEILAVCNDECRVEEKRYKEFYLKSLEYIHRNYGDADLRVSKVAQKVSTNETYLRKAFNDYLGMSPKAYIDNLRIKKAKSMLKSGYYSIKEIAIACGFRDEKYFSTSFVKHEGCNPSHYRQINI